MSYSPPTRSTAVCCLSELFLFSGLALCAIGCSALGVIADKTQGDKPVPAQYTFPKDEPVVVLIENYHNPDSVALSAELVGRQIYDDLKEHKVGPLIDPNQVSSLRTERGDAFKQLSITQVGKLVGAKHVLYGQLASFDLDPAIGANTLKGHTRMEVRVVNVRSGQTEWPAEISGGENVKAETSYVQLGDGITPDTVRDRLIHSLSSQTARLFFAARPSEFEDDTPAGPQ